VRNDRLGMLSVLVSVQRVVNFNTRVLRLSVFGFSLSGIPQAKLPLRKDINRRSGFDIELEACKILYIDDPLGKIILMYSRPNR